MDNKEIINELIKNGGTLVKGLTIKNVTVTVKDSYIRLGITIDKPIAGYILQDDGSYAEGEVNVVFVSAYSITSLLKDDENAAFAANHLLKHPDALGMIMSRAKIDVIQEPVGAKDEYKNPFASSDEVKVFGHDTIINHIVKIELSEFGLKRLERLADMMMGY